MALGYLFGCSATVLLFRCDSGRVSEQSRDGVNAKTSWLKVPRNFRGNGTRAAIAPIGSEHTEGSLYVTPNNS